MAYRLQVYQDFVSDGGRVIVAPEGIRQFGKHASVGCGTDCENAGMHTYRLSDGFNTVNERRLYGYWI